MRLEDTLFILAGRPVSFADLLIAGGALGLALLIAAVILAWRTQRARSLDTLDAMRRASELEMRVVELSGHLKSFADQAASGQARLTRTIDERLDHVSHRLGRGLTDQSERTHASLRQLHERLAVIDAAQANLTQLSTEMVSLKDILSNKQARGAYGQGRMEAIVRDGLHAAAYEFQGTLSNGTKPDCLIKLPESNVRLVIDAKFPLEAFTLLKNATGEADIKNAEARLKRDIGIHVKTISEKYLISGETHETAVMFVPSESIYADLHERFEDVIQKAHRARVIIASPNLLMLIIQTMQAIFKDARMREQAGVIKIEVTRLLDDVSRLKDRVLDLQRHFGQASGDLEKLGVSADKISKRGQRIEQLDLEEAPVKIAAAEPAALRVVGKD
ncbi:DNA recombination protein RmuC [soil metagenome]